MGVLITVELAVLVVISGIAGGLALALIRSSRYGPSLADHFRRRSVPRPGPPLVIIVLIISGLPSIDIAPSGFVSPGCRCRLVLMAFAEEIFWPASPRCTRPWEASRSDRAVLRPNADERGAAAGRSG